MASVRVSAIALIVLALAATVTAAPVRPQGRQTGRSQPEPGLARRGSALTHVLKHAVTVLLPPASEALHL
jgi:hypothetical protein